MQRLIRIATPASTPQINWDTVPWQPLPLAAGWVPYDTSGSYTPRFVKRAGIVFIAGLIFASVANSANSMTVATLPAGYRPAQVGSPTAWGSNGAPPIILVPSGELQIYGPVSVGFVQWLDISFAV